MGAMLYELFEALAALGEGGPLQATSLHLPKALHHALCIATAPDLVDEVGAAIERREPDWALTALDDTVDDVLAYVELLAAGVGRPSA